MGVALKGNCNVFFAFLSSPGSISKCGKISKLLVKYPLCCGQSFYNTSCCGRAYLWRKYVNGSMGEMVEMENGIGKWKRKWKAYPD